MIDNDLTLGVSVIICCYNSALRLPETLKHLANQQVPTNISWEVIVVDNASTDDTANISAQIWGSLNVPHLHFKVTHQPVAGLKFAREKGIVTANFEYLLFCDDDNWLSEAYVATAYNIMQADNLIGVLGGHGIIQAEKPALLSTDHLSQITPCGKQTWAADHHWVYGAGAVYRKNIVLTLSKAGWQQLTVGRKGKSLTSAEDVEICFIVYLFGYKIVADDRLTFMHFVPASRQKIAYLLKLKYWLSYSNTLLYSYFHLLHNEQVPIEQITKSWLKVAATRVIKQKLLLLKQTVFKRQKLSLDQQSSFQANLGIMYALLYDRKRIIDQHNHVKHILSVTKHKA